MVAHKLCPCCTPTYSSEGALWTVGVLKKVILALAKIFASSFLLSKPLLFSKAKLTNDKGGFE